MEEGDKNTGNINSILQNKNLMAVIVIAIVVALGLILYIYSLSKNGAFEASQPFEISQKIKPLSEAEIQKQLEEIDRLRKENNVKPLSESETKKQLSKIEAERKKNIVGT